MIVKISATIIFLLLSFGTNAKAAGPKCVFSKQMEGSIDGRLPISMSIEINGMKVTGKYYYHKYKRDITLVGDYQGDDKMGGLNLTEYNNKGDITGYFEGELNPAGCYIGVWKPSSFESDFSKWLGFEVCGTPFVPEDNGEYPPAGKWTRLDYSEWQLTKLYIGDVRKDQFWFSIDSINGCHTGGVSGTAIADKDKYQYIETERNSKCKLTFIKKEELIGVEQEGCDGYGGIGVFFGGTFSQGKFDYKIERDKKDRSVFMNLGIFSNANQEIAFANLVGEYYDTFADAFSSYNENTMDKELNAHVYEGYIRGCYKSSGWIIIVGQKGEIWAAVLSKEEINYFSNINQYKRKPPKVIQEWAGEEKIIYH